MTKIPTTEIEKKAFSVAFDHYISNHSNNLSRWDIYQMLVREENIINHPDIAVSTVYEHWSPRFMKEQIDGLCNSIKSKFKDYE